MISMNIKHGKNKYPIFYKIANLKNKPIPYIVVYKNQMIRLTLAHKTEL